MIVRLMIAAAVTLLPTAPVVSGRDEPRPEAGQSCRPTPPPLSRVLEISDRVIRAKVTRVIQQTAPKANPGEPRLERGVFDLMPVEVLKGSAMSGALTLRYDAILYPDLFGGAPCRWSALPVEGEIWLIVASRDGEDCAGCDGRLDATHKLYYLAPESGFAR